MLKWREGKVMRVTNQPLHVVLFFFFLFFPPFFFSHLFHSKTTLWYGPKGLKHAHAWLHAHLECADEQVKCKRQTFREREETLEKRKKIKEYLKGWMDWLIALSYQGGITIVRTCSPLWPLLLGWYTVWCSPSTGLLDEARPTREIFSINECEERRNVTDNF